MKNKIQHKITKGFVSKVKEVINNGKTIAITSHVFPDDDSIASVMAMHYYLIEVVKADAKVEILYTGKRPKRWENFPRYKYIKFVDDVSTHLEKYDILIILDGSGWNRFSNDKNISRYKGTTICIDHHPNPSDIFNYHIVGNQYSSTSEIVYRMFFNKIELSKEICEILLIGIYGDTGNITYIKSDGTQVFKVVSRLIQEGDVDIEILLSKYSGVTWRAFKVFSEFAQNTEKKMVKGWPKLIVSKIDRNSKNINNYTDNEMNEARQHFYSYLKSIEDYTWGFIAIPLDKGIKVSGRSQPNSVSLRDLMERLEIGGGHDRAASGVMMVDDVDQAIGKVIGWMKNNKPLLS